MYTLRNCATSCVICRALTCMYGASTTTHFLFQALHDMLPCELNIWQGLDKFCMVPENRHSHDQVLLQDVTQQDLDAKPISCYRTMLRMLTEVRAAPVSFFPCQGPFCPTRSMMARWFHGQALQLPDALVCRHSNHSSLRWSA